MDSLSIRLSKAREEVRRLEVESMTVDLAKAGIGKIRVVVETSSKPHTATKVHTEEYFTPTDAINFLTQLRDAINSIPVIRAPAREVDYSLPPQERNGPSY